LNPGLSRQGNKSSSGGQPSGRRTARDPAREDDTANGEARFGAMLRRRFRAPSLRAAPSLVVGVPLAFGLLVEVVVGCVGNECLIVHI